MEGVWKEKRKEKNKKEEEEKEEKEEDEKKEEQEEEQQEEEQQEDSGDMKAFEESSVLFQKQLKYLSINVLPTLQKAFLHLQAAEEDMDLGRQLEELELFLRSKAEEEEATLKASIFTMYEEYVNSLDFNDPSIKTGDESSMTESGSLASLPLDNNWEEVNPEEYFKDL